MLTDTLADPNRNGPYQAIYSGKLFYPDDPRPGDFDIETIAHALSNICRFGGHTRSFYSVAQHLVLCTSTAMQLSLPFGVVRQVFAHDWSEAYVIDVPRPLKKLLAGYLPIEEKVQRAICEQFGIDFPFDPAVAEIDNRMLVTEASQLLTAGPDGKWWEEPGWPQPFDIRIEPWSPGEAKRRFLETCARWKLVP